MKFSKYRQKPLFSHSKMVKTLLKESSVILGIYFLGETVVWLLDSQFPGSVVGMLLLLGALHLQWVKVDDIRLVSSWLLGYMPLFFIPAGVSVMVSYTLMQEFSLSILVIVMLSTLVVMVATAKVVQFLVRKERL